MALKAIQSQPRAMREASVRNRSMKLNVPLLAAAIICSVYSAKAFAQNQGNRGDQSTRPEVSDVTNDRPAKGIQDNSFLVEEAYNQEPGVVQSFATMRGQGRDRFFAFTQEFPVGGQEHQLSYLLPYAYLRSDGQRARGVGDVLFNYRYQALFESDVTPAFAPRLSLIVPTGRASIGTGNGSFGFQGNLPFSKIVTDRITLHANAGLTSLFDVQDRRPTSFNLGGSIVYAATRDLNILLETVGERIATVNATGKIERQNALTISPGARYAFNFSDTQIVVGVGAPVTFEREKKPAFGAIFYLSVESKFIK